jgi:hypothetical protein
MRFFLLDEEVKRKKIKGSHKCEPENHMKAAKLLGKT